MLLSEGERSRGGIGRISTGIRDAMARDPSCADIVVSIRPSRLRESGVSAHLSTPGALIRFARACRRNRYDAVHINVAPRGSTWRKTLFAAVARAAGCKVLLHLHGSGYDEWYGTLGRMGRAAVQRLFQRADTVVALGEHWRRFLIDAVGVDAARVHVIPNGVPVPPAGQAQADTQPPLVVSMGVVGERKGTDLLITALARLKRDGVSFRAVVGGNGAVAWARALAQDAGVADDIMFTGWIGPDAVEQHLRTASLFVLPSRQENQPMSILEAMAAGVPVVASAIGAIPEQVVDGVSGLLVPAGDADALADAIGRLLADGDRRRDMGAAGRDRIVAEFSIALCARRFAALYRDRAARG